MEAPRQMAQIARLAHTPVLLEETLAFLLPSPAETLGVFVDCTVGAAGHAAELLVRAPRAQLLAIDKDPRALELARQRLAPFGERVSFVQDDFKNLHAILSAHAIPAVAGIFADLGVSSLQLDSPERGFSFRFDAPLDMRMGASGPTAADIVNHYAESALAAVFRDYGEEPAARAIARRIVMQRARAPIGTTAELRALIHGAKRGRRAGQKIDPATRVFQALRIEVNHELTGLAEFLDDAAARLAGGGRLAILTFHSLEDRIIKWGLKGMEGGCTCPPSLPMCVCSRTRIIRILTKRAVVPAAAEVAANPRSRSAKLRAAEKVL